MAKKIESLTQAQWQQMRDYREEQRGAALRTDTIDTDAAKAAVLALYAAAGLKEPQHVLFFQSPIQCLMARGLLRLGNWDQLWDQLRDQLRGQLGGQLWGQLGDQLWGQLRDQLRGQLGGQLWGQLRDQLRGQLWDQLGDQLWGQLRDQLRGQLGDQLRGQLGDQLENKELWQETWFVGGWDSFWLAFYDFGRQIGVTYSAKAEAHLNAYRAYADACGVAYLYPNVALISDRPERISFDHMRRLHADDGPALLYRDGYAIHAWHGQRVIAEWIEKRHEITPEMIRAEKNAEMRRVLTEIYAHVHGPGRIIQDMGAKLLSEDVAQDRPRRLYEVDGGRFIHVLNGSLEPDGSRREFFLGAETNAKTPHEAIAASYGRPAIKYAEAVRT